MPGLHKVRGLEQNDSQLEVGKEEADLPRAIAQGRDPADMPDLEDLKEELVPPSRRSTERSAPPPVPQGKLSRIVRY